MSNRIPIVKVKIFEKLLFYLGSIQPGKAEVMSFTGTLMADLPRCHIIEIRIQAVL